MLNAIPILGLILVLALVLVVVVNTATPMPAFAADTGFFNANQTVASNSVSQPDGGWTSNNQYATFDAVTDTADYGFADLGIPSGAVIDGIEVTIEGQRNGPGGDRNLNAAMWNTSASNPDAYTTAKIAVLGNNDQTLTLGGPTDKWGTTWTIADFADATFKIRVGVPAAASGDAALDAVRVKVYYITPTTLTVSTATGTYGGTASLTATLTVTASGAPVSGKTISFTLNGSPAGTATTIGSGVASIPAASLSGINAATYGTGVGASFAGDATYGTSSGSGSLTVNTRSITVTADNAGKTYGDGDPALSYQITSGSLAVGDTFTGDLVRVTGEDVNTYAIQQGSLAIDDGNGGLNCDLTFVDGQLEITPKELTITGIAGVNKVYDGTTDAVLNFVSPALVGVIGGDNVTPNTTGAVGTFVTKNVGTGVTVLVSGLSLDGADAGNYTLIPPTTTADIDKADQTMTAQTNTKTYDGDTTAAAVPTVSGLMPGDTVTDLSEVYDNRNVGIGKILSVDTYTVNDGNGGANYNVILVTNTTGVINQATLTVTGITADSKTYDGTTDATVDPTGAVLVGVIGAEDVGVDDSGAVATFDNKNVGGPKTVTVTGLILTGADAGNYTLTPPTATAAIAVLAIEVTADHPSKVYGDTDPPLTWTVTGGGLVGSDNFTGALARACTHTYVGSHIILQGTLAIDDGNGGNNYILTFVPGLLDITPLAIEVMADDQSKVYGDGDPLPFTYQITSDSLAFSGNFTGLLNRVTGENVGFYAIQQGTLAIDDGNGGLNYNLTFVDGELEITARELTITGITGITGSDKVYDGTTDATVDFSSAVLVGVIGAEDVAVDDSGAVATFDNKNVGSGKTVTVTGLVLTGVDAGNYTLTPPTTTADITQRDLTVTAAGINKVYDGGVTATVNLSTDALGGDTVTAGYSASFANKNVGTGKAVSVIGISIGGTDAGNYNLLNTTASTTANIAAKALTVTATGVNKVYDGTTVATVTLSDNRVAGDVLTTGYSASFADKNVGTGKAVSVIGISIGGADAANYTFNTTASTTTNITAKALTVTATGVNKVYDGTTMATVTLSNNRVAGDVLTTSYASASFADANVGIGKVVSVIGISINGVDAGNYTFNTPASTTADITAAPLTVTANNRAKIYGATVTFAGTEFAAGGLVNADTVTGVTLTSAGAAASSAVAGSPYSIVPSAAVGTGLGNYTISYVNGSLTVTKASIGLTASSSLTTVVHGREVTFTATVTGTGATGTVTFKDGETILGSSTLSNGTATYATSTLAAGTHDITAVYGRDANFAGNTSSAVPLTVKTPSGVNWALIGAIIAAVVLFGLFFLLLLIFGRRRKKPDQPAPA